METRNHEALEDRIDEALAESFPASDAPFWTLGVTPSPGEATTRGLSMTRPAEPERHDPHVGMSNANQSSWDWESPYLGPPEAGQPRAGSASLDPPPAPPPPNAPPTPR
jgi:hypothetical protein